MRHFHFSAGDSTTGAIGLCGRVRAETEQEAVAKLRSALETSVGAFDEVPLRVEDADIEYLNVYINPANISASDIEGRQTRNSRDERGFDN